MRERGSKLHSLTKCKSGQGIANVGIATIAGGIASKRNGGTFANGAGKGFKMEARNQSYRMDNDLVRHANRVYGTLNDKIDSSEICPGCGQTLISEFTDQSSQVIVDADSNRWHVHCAQEELGEAASLPKGWGYQDVEVDGGGEIKKQKPKVRYVKSHIDDKATNEQLLASFKITGRNSEHPGTIVGRALNNDLYTSGEIPAIPEILAPYLQEHKATIDTLIRSGDPSMIEAVVLLYAKALVQYAYDNELAEVGEYSRSPESMGNREEDIVSVYQDMLKEIQ